MSGLLTWFDDNVFPKHDNCNADGSPTHKPHRCKPPKKIVCPICWRGNCKLFVRLNDLKFDDAERLKFITVFHRRVCKVCKRLACPNFGKCPLEKKLDVARKCLPSWATN